MKKLIILTIIFFTMTVVKSFADVIPQYSYNIPNTGIGAFNAPQEFTIYQEPNENSKIIKTIKWDNTGMVGLKKGERESDIFVVFLPKKNIAYCTVDEEVDGWVKIFYSQRQKKSGWVKTTAKNRYVSWLGFYMSWGRKNSVYFFKDMPEINKRIMSAPDATSQKIGTLTYPKFIKLMLVRGNWMLVRILDFGDEYKVGWMLWRDENAKFMIFPNMVAH